MNMSELAIKMLQWEEQKRKLDELEAEIGAVVLDLGKTQTAGNVRATYSKGRAKYDYETPGSQAEEEIIGLYSEGREFVDWEGLARSYDPSDTVITSFTEFETIINWRNVCRAADIEPLIESQGEPSVKLKLLE
jgi:hypothetical protein